MEGQGSVLEVLLETFEREGDVTFLVGPEGNQEEIKSSVVVLRAFSSVFKAQFNETWKSQKDVIQLPDIQPKMFRLFLKLLLTDNLDISHLASAELCMEDIVDLLYIANKYDVSSIQSICRTSIKTRLAVDNAVFCYETLQNMNEPDLEKTAFDFITRNIVDLLVDQSFKDLSHKSLTAILKCDYLSVRELPLFKGVCGWAESKCTDQNEEQSGASNRKMLGDLLFMIRFPLMTYRDFYEVVQPIGILTPEEIVDICGCMALKKDSSFVKNSRFSTKVRPNASNEAVVVTMNPSSEYCYVFTPASQTPISKVVMYSAGHLRHQGYYYYELKLYIWDGDDDILPITTLKFSQGCSLQLLNLDKTIALEPNRKYFIYYDLKRNGTAESATINLGYDNITFSVC